MEDEQVDEEPEKTPSEKKVNVGEAQPEVFTILPGTTEVQLELPPKKPPPSKSNEDKIPEGPNLDLGKIISETLDIVEQNQKNTFHQKLVLQKMAYMLKSIEETMKAYEQFIERMNRFMVNHDALQAEWYYNYCTQLPCYGDYLKIFKAEGVENIKVLDGARALPESELHALVQKIVNNGFAGGMNIKSQRLLCMNINNDIGLRKNAIYEYNAASNNWFLLLNNLMEHQNMIRDMLFRVSAHVGFLQVDDPEPPLKLDLATAIKDSSVGDNLESPEEQGGRAREREEEENEEGGG